MKSPHINQNHHHHHDRYLDLLATDSGSVHHLLCLVGLLLGAIGDERIPGGKDLVCGKTLGAGMNTL